MIMRSPIIVIGRPQVRPQRSRTRQQSV